MIHCLRQLFDHVLTAATERKFDAVVQQWALYPKQHHMTSYYKEYPRLLFSEGILSITDISAQTKVEILFVIVVDALTKNGRHNLLDDTHLTENQYLNMIEAFEHLMCYWEWLKKPKYWNINDMDALYTAKDSVHQLIERLKLLFPRSAGNQWRIPKIHEQLHIVYNIYLFGAHQNIHSSLAEHNHIEITKKASQHVQKSAKTFDFHLIKD